MAKRVAILGGGIAGLSLAHQLVRWNQEHPDDELYEISVFESRGHRPNDLGGKARTWRTDLELPPVVGPFEPIRPGSSVLVEPQRPPTIGSAPGLPGEHGFRFFPGFYKNVIQTMQEIPDGSGTGRTVAKHLVALEESAFYAESVDPPEGWAPPAGAVRAAAAFAWLSPWLSPLWLVVVPTALVMSHLTLRWLLPWAVLAVLWKLVHWIVDARALDGEAFMEVEVRTSGDKDDAGGMFGSAARRRLMQWWWLAAVPVFVWLRPSLRWWVLLAVVGLVSVHLAFAMAMRWIWRDIRGRMPPDVKPRAFESMWCAVCVAQLVTSCPRRLDTVWERRSWWEHCGAARFSHRYKVALATGLTRSFVATRAEQMSARTGGTILAQLIYDLNPNFKRARAADSILDGPTTEVWIEPWVAHLRAHGVVFNPVVPDGDGGYVGAAHPVLVQRLLVDEAAGRIRGFEYNNEITCAPPTGLGVTAGAQPVRSNAVVGDRFDRYVLAVSGTSAQWILGNSPEVTALDRSVAWADRPVHPMSAPNPVPYLDGVFLLEFGWMSGIVFHLDRTVTLPKGHLLCLDSEWALTVVDQKPHWEGVDGIESSEMILSVNVSDWNSPSRAGRPARLTDMAGVVDDVWAQMVRHIPQLRDLDGPPAPAQVIIDKAITDPDAALKCLDGLKGRAPNAPGTRSIAGELENLPMTNSDRLLVNTAGSWQARPCVVTGVPNLTVVGDYVRTQVDFASMESADESARWAAKAIIEADHTAGSAGAEGTPPEPVGLEDPAELHGLLRTLRWLDGGLYRLGLASPLALVAAPLGWFAKGEDNFRSWLERRWRAPGLPPRRVDGE